MAIDISLRQKLEQRDARRSEDVRSEGIFKVQYADKLGLPYQGQTEDRSAPLLREVMISRELIMNRCVIKNDTFQRAHDVLDDRNRKLGGCHARPMDTDFDPVATCSCFGFDPLCVAFQKNQETPIRARMLDSDPHEDLDQLINNDLTRERLRGYDHRSDLAGMLDGDLREGLDQPVGYDVTRGRFRFLATSKGTATDHRLRRVPALYRLTARFGRLASGSGASSHRLPLGSGRGIVAAQRGVLIVAKSSFDRCPLGAFNVRFGSKADMGLPLIDVRFTPKSGHCSRRWACPLCANSGH